MTLEGTRFLITGGSLGIGRTLATDLVARGARVLVCGRTAERLDALRAQVPRIVTQVCDVRDQHSVLALAEKAEETFGTPDVVLNNAAVFQRFDVTDPSVSVDHWLREIDINVMGTLRVTHAMLPAMLKAGAGTIINVTSPTAYLPLVAAPIYSASKAAIHSWTVSLRHQLHGSGVSVIELNPPAVDTRMNQDNPDVEGLKLWSIQDFSDHVLRRLERSRSKDILVGDAKLVRTMSRLAPSFVFHKMNPKRPAA